MQSEKLLKEALYYIHRCSCQNYVREKKKICSKISVIAATERGRKIRLITTIFATSTTTFFVIALTEGTA
jgi:hypothetical protein